MTILGYFLAILATFFRYFGTVSHCLQITLSGNTVWPQASGFQKLANRLILSFSLTFVLLKFFLKYFKNFALTGFENQKFIKWNKKVRRTQRVHYVQVSQVIHPQKGIFKALEQPRKSRVSAQFNWRRRGEKIPKYFEKQWLQLSLCFCRY